MTRRGKVLDLAPTAMAAGGDAIARDEGGRVVFVTGALPGERVAVEMLGERRDYARGRVLDVMQASPSRVAPPCPELARGCGGCQWQHIELGEQRRLKVDIVADALRRIAKLDGVTISPTIELPAEAYRTTVRALVVGGRAGYRQARSHDLADVGSCLVCHPLVAELLVVGRYGTANEVVLRCGARTGERMAAPHPTDAAIEVPDDARRDTVHEEVAGRRWRISAASFFQARPDGADALVGLVRAAADEMGAPGAAVDLYSGVGLFAGALAERGWSTTAVEGSDAAVADARANVADDGVTVVNADVTTWRPVTADLVIADPSRNGLGRAGVATVAGTGARRLVLASCDPAAFGRDAALLTVAGYSLTSVTPVDLFPHTFHLEVVSVFDR